MAQKSTVLIIAILTFLAPSLIGCQQEPEGGENQESETAITQKEDPTRNPERGPDKQAHVPPKENEEEEDHQKPNHPKNLASGRLTLPPESLEGALIETTKVRKQLINDEIRATATIKPNQYELTHVSPRIQGKAIAVFAEAGQQVSAGETLALLDSLEVGQKKADFLKARTNLRIAKRNYAREQRLFAQKISSETEYLAAKGAYERSVTDYLAAREALRMMGMPEHEIKEISWSSRDESLSHLHLTSPIAGTVVTRHITRGELITPKDKPFTIADLSTVWIILDIYEEDLSRVQVDSQVRVTTVAYPEEIFQATVIHIHDVLNPDTRTVDARVEIPNPDRRLRPGMFAHASLTAPPEKERRGLFVPQNAVQHIDDRPTIFVQIEPGTYEVRHVKLGATFAPFVEVHTGVSEGETVVGKGSFYLKSVLQKEQMGGH